MVRKLKKRYILIAILAILILLSILLPKSVKYDLALKGLSGYKKIVGNEVVLDNLPSTKTTPPDHKKWDSMLKKYVDHLGWVNYKAWSKDTLLLHQYLDEISKNPPGSTWTKEEQLAYWINAYNAFTIKLILDHYPIQSIKDIGGTLPMVNSPWDLKFFRIGGIDFDLNTIEHEILRKKYHEPRIHFAINCASISCPILRREAYLPNKIYTQLDEQARIFLRDSEKNKITSDHLQISKIFLWFKNDFTENENIVQYLQKYSTTSISPKPQISHLPYNWNLNESR